MQELILLKLGEVVLKGLNRHTFEDKLLANIRRRVKAFGNFNIYSRQSERTPSNFVSTTVSFYIIIVFNGNFQIIGATDKCTIANKLNIVLNDYFPE